MNQDYIIGRGNPHILFADYVGDASTLSNAADAANAGGKSGAAASPAKQAMNESEHELSFDDLIDIVNPLQHIPVVNYIYRAITGDKISGFAEVAGGALYGGPLGLVGGVVSAAFNDETGHSPAETMVADVLGLEDHATMVAKADRAPRDAGSDTEVQLAAANPAPAAAVPALNPSTVTLATQLAAATDATIPPRLDAQIAVASNTSVPRHLEAQVAGASNAQIPPRLDTQLAQAMPKPQSLDNQIAMASLPPVGPSPVAQHGKRPYGGMMDMAMVEKAKAGAPSISESPATDSMQVASSDQATPTAAVPIASAQTPSQPQDVPDGTKFYSLAKVNRQSPGTTPRMPTYGGPDVRLKSVSAMAVNGRGISPTQAGRSTAIAIPDDQDAAARKILGLPSGQPVAALDGDSADLTPVQADLMPAYGNASQAVPNTLIEDMMKMGLDKYQKGLQNGTLGGQGIDVRG